MTGAVAIIPARGGSVRVPRKNIKPFHGRPIIEYSIATAFESGLFEQVSVSTDDDEVWRVAHKAGAHCIGRPTDDGTQGTQAVAAHALQDISLRRLRPALVCVLYPCAPLLDWRDLWAGYRALLAGRDMLYSMSVDARTDQDIGGFYWGLAQAVAEGIPIEEEITGGTSLSWHSRHCVKVPIPSSRSIDINTEEDWSQAEAMFAALRRAT